nr:hypothetical protein L203_00551 [Cryptococcus depauperatus CBS 7841]
MEMTEKVTEKNVGVAPGNNWAQLQKRLSSTSKQSTSKGRSHRSGMLERKDTRSKPVSQGISQYTGRPEVVANAKTTISERLPELSKKDMISGKVKAKEPYVLLQSPSNEALVNELRHMVIGNHILTESQKSPGQYLSMDCEMVGVGPNGNENALARVSIVNYHGAIILDTFVQPREPVTDYRTWISDVRAADLMGAPQFHEVNKQVSGLIEDKILVGHAIENDLRVLMLTHPGPLIRDTQKYKTRRERANTRKPGLAKLSELLLGVQIQMGAHSSVIDARVTMAIYRLFKKEWEKSVWHLTEAYRNKTKSNVKGWDDTSGQLEGNKRKRSNSVHNQNGLEEDNDYNKSMKKRKGKEQLFEGGRKGISSGLDVIVRRNGKRVDDNGRGDGSRRRNERDFEKPLSSIDRNWWDEPAQ